MLHSASALWFLFMRLNNRSLCCSTWVRESKLASGSQAKVPSDSERCTVPWFETPPRQSPREQVEMEVQEAHQEDSTVFCFYHARYIGSYLTAWNDHSKNSPFIGPQQDKDNQISPVPVDGGRELQASAPRLKEEAFETYESPSESFKTLESVAAFPLDSEAKETTKLVKAHISTVAWHAGSDDQYVYVGMEKIIYISC